VPGVAFSNSLALLCGRRGEEVICAPSDRSARFIAASGFTNPSERSRDVGCAEEMGAGAGAGLRAGLVAGADGTAVFAVGWLASVEGSDALTITLLRCLLAESARSMSRADPVGFAAAVGAITSGVEVMYTGPGACSTTGSGPGGAADRSSLRAWIFSSMDMPSAAAIGLCWR
jgi:hypothetical protein